MATSTSSSLKIAEACFGAGCFWGVEKYFRKEFGKKGLIDATVGYMGGDDVKYANASYEDVCTGKTGHAEVCYLKYDSAKLNYADIVEYFYRFHDPTTKDRQAGDTGSQYRSHIFTYSDEQQKIAKEVTAAVQEKHYKSKTIVTKIAPASKFWKAEDYHQKYLEENPTGYCSHRLRW